MAVRNLQKSHNFRLSVQKWGEPAVRKRIIIAPSMASMEGREVKMVEKRNTNMKETGISKKPVEATEVITSSALYSIDREIAKKRAENERMKTWIAERTRLRRDLGNMGLRLQWLTKKKNRTDCEDRVMDKMVQDANALKRSVTPEEENDRNDDGNQMEATKRLEAAPLPIALAYIAEYLEKKRMRLIDLFAGIDKNKDWKTSKTELKKTLVNSGITVSDFHLDELISSLDVNNDDELSYQEMARGIEAYYKDQRWQRLKQQFMDDANSDDGEDYSADDDYKDGAFEGRLVLPDINAASNLVGDKPATATTNKSVEFQLMSPDVDGRSHGMLSRSRSKTKKMSPFDLDVQRIKLREEQTQPTRELGSEVAEMKQKYMDYIVKECERCIELLQAAGIRVKPDSLRRVLVPPTDNEQRKCALSLRPDHSIYPADHEINARAKRRTDLRIRSLGANIDGSPMGLAVLNEIDSKDNLPRVANLDLKNRMKDGRKRRNDIAHAKPSPYWPQALLDKTRLCMDKEADMDGGKSGILFHTVHTKYSH